MEEKILKKIPEDMKIVEPVAGKVTREDWKRLAKNALKFSSVPLIVFLTALQSGVELRYALYAMYAPFINVIIDYLTKLNSDTPELRDK